MVCRRTQTTPNPNAGGGVHGAKRGPRVLNEILGDIKSYIEWELEEGNLTAEVAPDIVAALSNPPGPGGSGSTPTAEQKASLPRPSPLAPPPSSPVPSPVPPSLSSIAADIARCTRCGLHADRTNTVPGQGNPSPEILFVGEAPGKDEDEQGLAFVGRAGQLLTKMIEAMGYQRDDVFIANINKCRPPENRKPTPEEMTTCLPFLKQQIAVLKPRVIIAMGATAVEGLVTLPAGQKISTVRGQWLSFEGIPLMPTYHPAYLLRDPSKKRPVWDDLKTVLGFLGRPVPPVKRADAS